MKITRKINEKELTIELTPEEIREAATQYTEECHIEDIKSKLQETLAFETDTCVAFDDENSVSIWAQSIVPQVEHAISNNDAYFEAFWESIDDCIYDALAENDDGDERFSIKRVDEDVSFFINEQLVAIYTKTQEENGELLIMDAETCLKQSFLNKVRDCINKEEC